MYGRAAGVREYFNLPRNHIERVLKCVVVEFCLLLLPPLLLPPLLVLLVLVLVLVLPGCCSHCCPKVLAIETCLQRALGRLLKWCQEVCPTTAATEKHP